LNNYSTQMVDKSKLAIATSQPQNPIPFLLNYYSIYCLKSLLYLPLSLLVTPWALADRAKKFRVNSRAIFYAFKRMKITRKKNNFVNFFIRL